MTSKKAYLTRGGILVSSALLLALAGFVLQAPAGASEAVVIPDVSRQAWVMRHAFDKLIGVKEDGEVENWCLWTGTRREQTTDSPITQEPRCQLIRAVEALRHLPSLDPEMFVPTLPPSRRAPGASEVFHTNRGTFSVTHAPWRTHLAAGASAPSMPGAGHGLPQR